MSAVKGDNVNLDENTRLLTFEGRSKWNGEGEACKKVVQVAGKLSRVASSLSWLILSSHFRNSLIV